jgi:hypothetical protein
MRRVCTHLASGLLLLSGAGAVAAQTCTAADVAAVVEAAGAQLRKISAESQPRLQARLRQLAQRKGWSDIEAELKGYELLADAETRALDEQASQLLVSFDRLGNAQPTCAVVAELKTTAAQLVEVTSAKSAHLSVRLDATLRQGDGGQPARPSAPTEPQPKVARPAAPPPAATPAPPARPKPQPWQTETTVAAQQPAPPAPLPQAAPAPEVLARLPPPAPDMADLEFTSEDIAAAGRGFFGSISASLASVFEYAFKNYGRPTGYILGTEGGGALLAGLRYGDGTLVMKSAGERKVYWQGPSVGYDVGLAGSRVMFLVYSIRDPDQLFDRFGGIDGSAYLVGGVGITFLTQGRIVLAPIRTGLGLRLGANVGYLKFTARPSLNPF